MSAGFFPLCAVMLLTLLPQSPAQFLDAGPPEKLLRAIRRNDTNTVAQLAARGIATSVHEAAARGNIVALAAFANRTNVDARNELGFTPFHLAIQNGQLGAAALLLDRGADINAHDPDGNTALHQIIGNWSFRIAGQPSAAWSDRRNQRSEKAAAVSSATEKTDDGWSRSLVQATGFLLASGADAAATNHAGKSAAQIAMESPTSAFLQERTELLKLLGHSGANLDARDENDDTALHRAARHYDGGNAAELIAAGADVNATNRLGRTPLHASVEKLGGWGHEPVQEILAAKPNVNAQDKDGLTPLHLLLLSETSFHSEATKVLLAAGANPNQRDKFGRTPLLCALAGKWPYDAARESLGQLIAAGAETDVADNEGRNGLHYVAAMGIHQPLFFLRVLTNAFASTDVNATNRFGDTPLHIAVRSGTVDVFDWLRSRGASLDVTNAAGETPRVLAEHNRNPFSRFKLAPK